MKRFFLIFLIAGFIICWACEKNPASPIVSRGEVQSVKINSEIVSNDRITIGQNLFRMFNAQGEETVVWYADNGSGEADLRIKNGQDYLTLVHDGIAFNQGGRWGALQISQTGFPELFLYDGQIKCKLDAEDGGWADMGAEYRVAGKRIIGPRLTAIADATSPEDMIIKFNQLLEAMRKHGLIER